MAVAADTLVTADTPSPEPDLDRRESLLDEVEEKITSVWATLKDKPTEEDIRYAEKEKALYNNQLLPSRSEIVTWYLYDWANSPYWNVMIGLVIPLYLSAIAREYACEYNTEHGCDVNYDTIDSDDPLSVYMGNWALRPESFLFTMISLSGAMQAVSYITIGALADYSYYQFWLFRICTLIASIMPIVFVLIEDAKHYLFVGWWVAIQLVFFGLALIFYNAYLPQIVENHWEVRRAIRGKKSTDKVCKIKQQISDDMSSYGFACGYFGSLFMTLVTTVIFYLYETTEYEQLTGYGLTSGIDSDEQWMKPIDSVMMRFDTTNLLQIQLSYHGLDIDGDIYGSLTATESLLTYTIPEEGDYIISIDYWINDDQTINSMRFTSKNGVKSSIYGSATNDTVPDQIATTENKFVFAGYVVYENDNKENVNGMDVVMLNQETGQFQSLDGPRVISLLVFIWWNLFQIFCFKYFKRRDGPPLPDNSSPWTFGSVQFWKALKQATLYPNMFKYLISWFCFSDGLNTLSTTAVIFATVELKMTSTEAAVLVLTALFFGSVGGVFFLWLQRKIGWDAKRMLLLHIFTFIVMCLYTSLGFIPNIPFGLVSKGELYVFVFFYGLNWGSIQSYARSVFSFVVPVGKESQMFALYEITDKGSSWIGPLAVALITNHTTIRWGLVYVTTFFMIAAPLLIWGVDLKQGMKEAGRWKLVDKDDPNLQGIAPTTSNSSMHQMVPDTTADTEMVENTNTAATKDVKEEENGDTNNYDNPNLQIKVTSLDDEEAEKSAKEDEDDAAENNEAEKNKENEMEQIIKDNVKVEQPELNKNPSVEEIEAEIEKLTNHE